MPVSKKRKRKNVKKTNGGRFSERNHITEHQKDALEWAFLHNPDLLLKFLSDQGKDELGGALIANEASSKLIRSREYYSSSKNKPFMQAYLVSDFPNMETLPNNLRYMTVEAAFKSLHASIQRAFTYHDLPDFDHLFFGCEDELLRRIRVDFDSVSEQMNGEEITARAQHIIHEIDKIGGLGKAKRQDNDYRGPTIFGKIRELNATDKAYVYFYNYVKYRQLDGLIAFNSGFAHFQRGDFDRALFFYFMTGLLPFAGNSRGADVPSNCLDYLVRALIQKEYAKDCNQSPEGFREDLISRVKHFGKVENKKIDTYMLFGSPTFSRHEKIERSLLRLNRLIERKDKADAMGIFNTVKDELTIALDEYENEKFQADLIERLYNQVKHFIDFTISEGSQDVAFDAFEFYKSLILKLSLGEGRERLLKKLNTDDYYLKIKQQGSTFESTDNGERGAEDIVYQSAPERRENVSYDSFVNPSCLAAKNDPYLDHSTVFLEYYCGESQKGVFVCKSSDAPRFIPLSGLDICRDTVERLSECLSSVRSASGKSAMIETLLLSAYKVLIEPLSEILQGCNHIIISPTDFLFKCPFSALYDGEQYLIEKFTVSITPSHSLYIACLKSSIHSADTINFVRGDSKLKGIAEEMRCLTNYFLSGRMNVLTQLSEVKKKANDADILHLAAHGTFDSREPLLSRIHVGTSDALTVLDLYEMDLSKVRLAVVNACVTGKAHIAAADDLFGLVRGFFVAGCPSVINTLWNLNDEVAPVFTECFYRAVTSGQGVLDAFTIAVRAIARSNSYKNPYYWACYQYYGRP